jgi:hypothetical protein
MTTETPLEQAAREAREGMAEQIDFELARLREGERLAVGELKWTESWTGLHCEIQLLKDGEEPPEGQRWTIYTPLPRLRFVYTNHREESAARTVVNPRISWGSTEWYPEPQWLLEAFDADRMAVRVFALSRITELSA